MKRSILVLVLCFVVHFEINAQALLNLNQNDFTKSQDRESITKNNFDEYKRKFRFLKSQHKSLEEIYLSLKPNHVATEVSGSISGKITESDGLSPLELPLMIDLFNEFGEHIISRYFAFGASTYFIDNVPPGKYYVLVSADYYYIPTYYKNTHTWRSAELVEVNSGITTVNIDFALQQYQGAISGYVKNHLGEPINDCSIEALSVNGAQTSNYGTTDESGYYLIKGVPAGEYKVFTIYNGDENYGNKWYPDALNSEAAESVMVTDTDTTDNINFDLFLAGAVSGHILKPDGQPVREFSTSIVLYDLNETSVSYTSNDSENSFIIKNIPSGSYKVAISSFKDSAFSKVWYGDTDGFEEAAIITVTAPDTVYGLTIKFKEGGTISGKITGQGSIVNGTKTTLIVYDHEGKYIGQGLVSPSGNYSIPGLSTGKYKLQVSSEGFLTQWYNDKKTMKTADVIEVVAPNVSSSMNFILKKGTSISGDVFTPSGGLLTTEATVSALSIENGYSASAYVMNGKYELSNLEPGSYKLSINPAEFANEWYNNSPTSTDAEIITVTSDMPASNKNFQLDSCGFIQGYVSQDGIRIDASTQRILVSAFDASTGMPMEFELGVVAFNGGYKFKIAPGTYKIAAMSTYVHDGREQKNIATAWYGNGKSFNDSQSQTITVQPGKAATLNDINVQSASGSVSGTIFTKSGSTPEGYSSYTVFAFDEDGYFSQGSSYNVAVKDNDGKFKITGLHPGKYYIAAVQYDPGLENRVIKWYNNISSANTIGSKAEIPAGAITVTVSEGNLEGIDFIMETSVGVEPEDDLNELSFKLEQNYPNPFNPATKIRFNLPAAGYAELKVYDILGNEVLTNVNDFLSSGQHEFTINGENLSTGIYIYELRQNNFTARRKMILLK